MGHPVVGDLVYGRPPHYTGHGLHLTCTRLQWLHPASKTPLDVTVAPAKKMIRAVPGTFKQVEDSPWLDLSCLTLGHDRVVHSHKPSPCVPFAPLFESPSFWRLCVATILRMLLRFSSCV